MVAFVQIFAAAAIKPNTSNEFSPRSFGFPGIPFNWIGSQYPHDVPFPEIGSINFKFPKNKKIMKITDKCQNTFRAKRTKDKRTKDKRLLPG